MKLDTQRTAMFTMLGRQARVAISRTRRRVHHLRIVESDIAETVTTMRDKQSLHLNLTNVPFLRILSVALGVSFAYFATGCADGPVSESNRRGAVETEPAVQKNHEMLYRPRVIRGDYFLQKGIDADPTIKIGEGDKASPAAQEDLRKDVTELRDRVQKLEVEEAPSAVTAPPASSDSSMPAAGGPSGYEDLKRRLQTLKQLMEDGLISPQEYQSRRQAILDSL